MSCDKMWDDVLIFSHITGKQKVHVLKHDGFPVE